MNITTSMAHNSPTTAPPITAETIKSNKKILVINKFRIYFQLHFFLILNRKFRRLSLYNYSKLAKFYVYNIVKKFEIKSIIALYFVFKKNLIMM